MTRQLGRQKPVGIACPRQCLLGFASNAHEWDLSGRVLQDVDALRQLRICILAFVVPPTGLTVMPMTARCASATNPVEPGTASVIPPRKGYARLTRIEFETIYSAADAA